jgi:hypothetical protein
MIKTICPGINVNFFLGGGRIIAMHAPRNKENQTIIQTRLAY